MKRHLLNTITEVGMSNSNKTGTNVTKGAVLYTDRKVITIAHVLSRTPHHPSPPPKKMGLFRFLMC
jgi:hypothetical protein